MTPVFNTYGVIVKVYFVPYLNDGHIHLRRILVLIKT